MIAFLPREFPFLFGGTFIEGQEIMRANIEAGEFPFLFGGTFIEGYKRTQQNPGASLFPFLFGGTFIEGRAGADAEKLPL